MRTVAVVLLMTALLAGCSTTTYYVFSPSECNINYKGNELYAEKVPDAYELWRCVYRTQDGGYNYPPIGGGLTRTSWPKTVALLAVVVGGGFLLLSRRNSLG